VKTEIDKFRRKISELGRQLRASRDIKGTTT